MVKTPDGNVVVAEGLILRKASRFALGTGEDALVPIPIFYDVKSGVILEETLPKDIQGEYKEFTSPTSPKNLSDDGKEA